MNHHDTEYIKTAYSDDARVQDFIVFPIRIIWVNILVHTNILAFGQIHFTKEKKHFVSFIPRRNNDRARS